MPVKMLSEAIVYVQDAVHTPSIARAFSCWKMAGTAWKRLSCAPRLHRDALGGPLWVVYHHKGVAALILEDDALRILGR